MKKKMKQRLFLHLVVEKVTLHHSEAKLLSNESWRWVDQGGVQTEIKEKVGSGERHVGREMRVFSLKLTVFPKEDDCII